MRPRAAGRKIPPSRRKNGRPHHLFFTKRDGAAWRYQRKIAGARKRFCLPEAKMRPGTLQSLLGCALTEPKFPVQKEGVYGGTWFPRQIAAARGAVPHCISAEMPRLGVQGADLIFQSGTHPHSPWRFSLGPPGGPFSFPAEKRMGGRKRFPWGKKEVRPPGAKPSWAALCAEIVCGPWPQTLVPARGGNPSSRAFARIDSRLVGRGKSGCGCAADRKKLRPNDRSFSLAAREGFEPAGRRFGEPGGCRRHS